MKIAFFGTGLLGAPMARQLLKTDFDLLVYNRTWEKALPLQEAGAELVEKSGDAMDRGDVFITMLTDYQAICDVLFFDPFRRFNGKTLIQMATISPAESLLLQERFEETGGEYLEAPVLGSIPQAETRSLFVLFGGSENQFKNWQSLLKNFGKKVIYFGDVGRASAAKLALNQLIASLTSAFSMSLGYLREKGVEIENFMEILRESALYAPTFDKKFNRMIERDFTNPNFPVKHLFKDVRLLLDEFEAEGIATGPLMGVEDILQRAIADGLSDLDYSALYNAVHPREEKEK